MAQRQPVGASSGDDDGGSSLAPGAGPEADRCPLVPGCGVALQQALMQQPALPLNYGHSQYWRNRQHHLDTHQYQLQQQQQPQPQAKPHSQPHPQPHQEQPHPHPHQQPFAQPHQVHELLREVLQTADRLVEGQERLGRSLQELRAEQRSGRAALQQQISELRACVLGPSHLHLHHSHPHHQQQLQPHPQQLDYPPQAQPRPQQARAASSRQPPNMDGTIGAAAQRDGPPGQLPTEPQSRRRRSDADEGLGLQRPSLPPPWQRIDGSPELVDPARSGLPPAADDSPASPPWREEAEEGAEEEGLEGDPTTTWPTGPSGQRPMRVRVASGGGPPRAPFPADRYWSPSSPLATGAAAESTAVAAQAARPTAPLPALPRAAAALWPPPLLLPCHIGLPSVRPSPQDGSLPPRSPWEDEAGETNEGVTTALCALQSTTRVAGGFTATATAAAAATAAALRLDFGGRRGLSGLPPLSVDVSSTGCGGMDAHPSQQQRPQDDRHNSGPPPPPSRSPLPPSPQKMSQRSHRTPGNGEWWWRCSGGFSSNGGSTGHDEGADQQSPGTMEPPPPWRFLRGLQLLAQIALQQQHQRQFFARLLLQPMQRLYELNLRRRQRLSQRLRDHLRDLNVHLRTHQQQSPQQASEQHPHQRLGRPGQSGVSQCQAPAPDPDTADAAASLQQQLQLWREAEQQLLRGHQRLLQIDAQLRLEMEMELEMEGVLEAVPEAGARVGPETNAETDLRDNNGPRRQQQEQSDLPGVPDGSGGAPGEMGWGQGPQPQGQAQVRSWAGVQTGSRAARGCVVEWVLESLSQQLQLDHRILTALEVQQQEQTTAY